MSEIWKDIPGYIGYYQVSDLGRVKSLARTITIYPKIKKPFQKTIHETIMHPALSAKDGYYFVYLQKNGIKEKCYVARLVLLVFRGPPNPGEEACHHPNNDKSNNKLDNLKWGDRVENQSHRKANGTYLTGATNPGAKLNNNQVKKILKSKKSSQDLAKEFSVTDVTINKIRRRVSYKNVTI